jgi:histidinol-phosphate phosphatase family protein
MNKVVLLDRDGTVIVDPPDERVTSEDKIKLFADTLTALKKLADAGFSAVLITNQAGIGEGLITQADFERVNAEIVRQLEQSGIKILNTYFCPHGPDEGCECRKPKPKMLLDAAREFEFDLSKSFMLGDHRSDILAGKAAGAKTILVRTANNQDEAPEADFQADSLTEAVEHII